MPITDEKHISQYKQLHNNQKNYGSTSSMFFEEICMFIDYINPKTVLDYGCGKGALVSLLREKYPSIEIYGYDPSVEEHSKLEKDHFDIIVNTDVLEHVPENDVSDVISHIASLSQNVFFNLHHEKASFTLPNGQNAHCTIKPSTWYHDIMIKYFDTVIALGGRAPILSAVITFDIDNVLLHKYNYIVSAEHDALKVNWFPMMFGISNNRTTLKITIFFIKITIKVTDKKISKIASLIPIKKCREIFISKFK